MAADITTIEISKEYLHFAAAHFTLFSATERENLHGHNFQVTLDATATVHDDGLTFDYNILKKALKALCDGLDEQVLMPSKSPYLSVTNDDAYTYVISRFDPAADPQRNRRGTGAIPLGTAVGTT
jgi:6-pyruvoyltetrahydropterin/6-carboxytetrahydropterin synthase